MLSRRSTNKSIESLLESVGGIRSAVDRGRGRAADALHVAREADGGREDLRDDLRRLSESLLEYRGRLNAHPALVELEAGLGKELRWARQNHESLLVFRSLFERLRDAGEYDPFVQIGAGGYDTQSAGWRHQGNVVSAIQKYQLRLGRPFLKHRDVYAYELPEVLAESARHLDRLVDLEERLYDGEADGLLRQLELWVEDMSIEVTRVCALVDDIYAEVRRLADEDVCLSGGEDGESEWEVDLEPSTFSAAWPLR